MSKRNFPLLLMAAAIAVCSTSGNLTSFAQTVTKKNTQQKVESKKSSELPKTNAGRRLGQLINAVNSDSEEKLKEFLLEGFSKDETSPIEQRMQHAKMVRNQVGKLTVQEVLESQPNQIDVRCSGSKGVGIKLGIRTEEEKPNRIANVRMSLVREESEKAEPLTEEVKKQLIGKIAEAMRDRYVFPKVGKEMADAVTKSLENGDYKKIGNRTQLAGKLTEQLRSICNDLHLRIRSTPRRAPKKVGNKFVDNHGFVKAEMLPGGVGYLRFDYFSSDPEARKTAAAAMNFLANSKSIIFDLRYNGGGNPQMIAFLTSYILDKKTHLNSFYNRPSDTTTESWTQEDVPGRKLGSKVPVYVLTSRRSFSGAEEFSYNLKHMKRGTLVGEVTGGGAHPVRSESLPGGFFISVPFARAINPITKKNWEGVGVVPHVQVSASEALDKALEMAQKGETKTGGKLVATKKDQTVNASKLRGEAQSLMQNQDFPAAEKVFEKIVDTGKSTAADHFNYGYCLHAAGKLDKAMKFHKLATKSERFAPIATYNIACVHSLQKRKDEAIKALKKSIELGFGDANQLENDSDMDNLRDDPRFKKILEELGG